MRPPRRRRRTSLVALALGSSIALAACGGGGFEEDGSDEPASSGDGPATLQVLIGSSGDAETKAVEDAAAAWAEESGNEVEVVVANDLAQQLSQGFAGGNPPDLFYVDAGVFGDYAEAGNLYPYMDQLADADDFYPNLSTPSPSTARPTAPRRTSRPSRWRSTPSRGRRPA